MKMTLQRILQLTLLVCAMLLQTQVSAQNMAVNADGTEPDGSAMLDVKSDSLGFLLPRMSAASKNAITSPANGLMVFQSDGESGLYYYDAAASDWIHLLDSFDVSVLEQGLSDVLSIDSNAQNRGIYNLGKLGVGTSSLGGHDFYLNGTGYVDLGANNNYFTIDNYVGGLRVWNTNANHQIRLRPNTGGPSYQSILEMNNNGVYLNLLIDDAPVTSRIESSTDLGISTGNGSGSFEFDAGGNLSIGTTSITTNRVLHAFSSSTASLGKFSTTASGSGLNDGFNFGYVDGLGGVMMLSENQSLQWGTNNSYRMWLDAQGYLGIGESNPQTVLAIQGNGGVNSVGITQNEVAGASAMEFTTADGVGAQATRLVLRGSTNSPNISFHSGASGSELEIMTLVSSSGRLGIGTTNPSSVLSLESSAGDLTSGINFKDGLNDWYIYQDAAAGLVFRDDGVDRITILANGNVGIGTTNPSEILHINGPGRSTSALWLTISDQRAKHNIQTIDGALGMIQKFRPVTFEWNEEFKVGKTGLMETNYGFISQEVEKVLPEMITTTTEIVANDTITDFKVLNKDPLIALMVKAIQEQQMQIEELKHSSMLQKQEIQNLHLMLESSKLENLNDRQESSQHGNEE